jgi:chromate transporter
VNEFVGFMAGHGSGGWMMGLAGAATALWMTFVPSFLFIFVGAPYVARLTRMPRLSGALAAITAAVVGVIANLSLWFALHVLFAHLPEVSLGPLHMMLPDPTSLRPVPTVIAVLAGWLLLRRHWPLLVVLALSAGMSAAATLL